MKQKFLLALGCILIASGAWATDYTLTLYADGCSSPNTFICSSGQQLSVSATPMAHRHFVAWNDGNTDNPRLVTMNQNLTYTATFAPDSFNISVVASPSTYGSVSGAGLYQYNSSARLTATANYGYKFSKWNDGNTSNPRTVYANGDATYVAQFVKTYFHVSVSSTNTTMGTATGGGSFLYQENVVLHANPAFGYAFKQWNDGNTDNPRTIYLERDTSLVASFYLVYEGECGQDLQWKYQTGILTISGLGDMYNFTSTTMPWKLFRDSIENVVINDGATSIGDNAFYGCQNRAFTKVVMPQSVKKIGSYAFADCNRLTSVVFSSDLEEVGDYAFKNCTRINDMTCYATITPNAYEHTFAGVNTMAYLYVQAGSARTYKLDPIWGVFDIHEIGAESTTVSGNSVLVEPSDNEAVFTWPMSDGASTYSLNITKDGVVFCTLTFNANGQLTNIAFAPSRDGSQHAPTAILTENGYQFTVTGLDYATHYAFSLDAKNAASQVVASYSGSFHTNGATALDNIDNSVTIQKVLRNGQLYIITPEGMFDALGRRVEE